MNLEQLLQKRFGLEGSLRKPAAEMCELLDRFDAERAAGGECDWWTPEIIYTEKGWEALERLDETLNELVEVGLLDEDDAYCAHLKIYHN